MKNRIFFIVQHIFKYLPFTKVRSFLYRFFFKSVGHNFIVQDGVTIKYPDEIIVGSNVSINQGCFIVGLKGLHIGNNVRIGAGSKIVTSTHNFEKIDVPIYKQGISAEQIQIEDDVWFGFDVNVFGGSKIGKGCILAAKTVVNGKCFSDYNIIGGIPGKVIKKRKK